MAASTASRTPGSGEDIRTYDNGSGVEVPASKIDVGGVTTESLWTEAAMADAAANPTIPRTASFNVLFNGTTWDRVRGDTTNGTDVDVTRLPTFGAAQGVYAEDAASASGDLGHLALAVRRDTPSADTGTAGDYNTLEVDNLGSLWIRQPPRVRTVRCDLVTQASAIAANDQLVDEFALTNAALIAGGSLLVVGLVLVSNNTTQIAAELNWYQANPVPAGTNAVWNQTDANEAASFPGPVVDFTVWKTQTDNIKSVGTVAGQPVSMGNPGALQCLDGTDTTNVWLTIKTLTAVTPGATTDYDLYVTYIAGV